MTWNTVFTQLRNVLADLYPSVADSRRVVFGAELNPQYINFSSMAINNWQMILEEAQKHDKIEALALVALKEYPKNTSLQAAVDAYREWVEQNKKVDRDETLPHFPTRLNTPQKMQLVDALLQCQTVSNRQTRDTVVKDLPDEIQHNIQRSANNRVDVVNIVSTALNYSDGLEGLIELVRMYEGNSIGMQEVDRVLAAIG